MCVCVCVMCAEVGEEEKEQRLSQLQSSPFLSLPCLRAATITTRLPSVSTVYNVCMHACAPAALFHLTGTYSSSFSLSLSLSTSSSLLLLFPRSCRSEMCQEGEVSCLCVLKRFFCVVRLCERFSSFRLRPLASRVSLLCTCFLLFLRWQRCALFWSRAPAAASAWVLLPRLPPA